MSKDCAKWPSWWCTPKFQFVLDQCPLMCGLCREYAFGMCNSGPQLGGGFIGSTPSKNYDQKFEQS